MSATVVRLDDHRPHLTGVATCYGCGLSGPAVVDARADLNALECPACGALAMRLPPPGRVGPTRCGCGEYQPPHPCPFEVEMDDDHEAACTCCAACEERCGRDT